MQPSISWSSSVSVFVIERMTIIHSLKCNVLFSFVVSLPVTHCHLLSLFLIRCHSFSFVVIRCTNCCHSFVPRVVTRCTTRCHSLSLVVTGVASAILKKLHTDYSKFVWLPRKIINAIQSFSFQLQWNHYWLSVQSQLK